MAKNKPKNPDFFDELFKNPENKPSGKAEKFFKILNSCLSAEMIKKLNNNDESLSDFEIATARYHAKRCEKCAKKIEARENYEGGKK